jgi:hypothetical protein
MTLRTGEVLDDLKDRRGYWMTLRTAEDTGLPLGQERILDEIKERRGYWMTLRTGEDTG